MFTDIGIDVHYQTPGQPPRTYRYYIGGARLLKWVKDAVDGVFTAAGAAPAGGDTSAAPMVLRGFSDWAAAAALLPSRTDREMFFQIGGRVIRKLARGGVPNGFADGYYVTDLALSGSDTVPTSRGPKPRDGTIWSREHGASYRDFGNFLHLKDSQSPLKGVDFSQRTGARLRMILKGQTGGHAPRAMRAPVDHSAAAPASAESALPLLSAAMFLAEPARNRRAWCMGLMLLDLLGAQYFAGPTLGQNKFYTLQRALVNPTRMIDPARYGASGYPRDPVWQTGTNEGTDTAPNAWVRQQARGKQDDIRTMSKPGSAAVEGLYPPSPKWSGRTGRVIDVANDYIQQKEVSIVCRWLEREFNSYVGGPTVTATALTAGQLVGRTEGARVDPPGESPMRGFAAELKRIVKTDLIARRVRSFDTPGVLFR